MKVWTRIFGVALLSSGMLAAAPVPHLFAATSAVPDILSDRAEEPADSVNLGTVRPAARPGGLGGGSIARTPQPAGNPLWAVPLSVLTATQQRPIFSASRRPPQPAVVAPPPPAAPPPAPVAAAPEHPALALIGSVVGDNDSIAVFLDRTSQKVVRLRQGESHAGWVLSAVQPREVILKKAGQTEIMGLQRQGAPSAGPAASAAAAAAAGIPPPFVPAAGVPVAGALDGSYAPFVPRSTPKNGQSDGL